MQPQGRRQGELFLTPLSPRHLSDPPIVGFPFSRSYASWGLPEPSSGGRRPPALREQGAGSRSSNSRCGPVALPLCPWPQRTGGPPIPLPEQGQELGPLAAVELPNPRQSLPKSQRRCLLVRTLRSVLVARWRPCVKVQRRATGGDSAGPPEVEGEPGPSSPRQGPSRGSRLASWINGALLSCAPPGLGRRGSGAQFSPGPGCAQRRGALRHRMGNLFCPPILFWVKHYTRART